MMTKQAGAMRNEQGHCMAMCARPSTDRCMTRLRPLRPCFVAGSDDFGPVLAIDPRQEGGCEPSRWCRFAGGPMSVMKANGKLRTTAYLQLHFMTPMNQSGLQ